jgi:hypothetical protein
LLPQEILHHVTQMNGGQPCLHHTLPKTAGGGFILTHAVQVALDRALHPYGIDGGALHGRGGTEPPEAADHGLARGFVIVAFIQSGHEQTRGKGVLFHGFSPFLTAVVGFCRFFQYTTNQKWEKRGKNGNGRKSWKIPDEIIPL